MLNNRQEVLDAFKTGIFPYIDGSWIKNESEEESEEKSEEESVQTDKKLNDIQKPSWVNIFYDNCNSLIQGAVNNLDNKNYQTTTNNQKYDLNKAKDFLLKISTENISKNEAQELYNNLIKPDVDALRKSKSKSKNIRSNILNVLENTESSLFENYYLNYKNVLKESAFQFA